MLVELNAHIVCSAANRSTHLQSIMISLYWSIVVQSTPAVSVALGCKIVLIPTQHYADVCSSNCILTCASRAQLYQLARCKPLRASCSSCSLHEKSVRKCDSHYFLRVNIYPLIRSPPSQDGRGERAMYLINFVVLERSWSTCSKGIVDFQQT